MFDELITNYKFLKNPNIKSVSNISIKGVLLSKHSDNNLEIVLCSSGMKPNSSSLRTIWKDRKAGTATPLLVVCSYNDKVSICGPLGDEPPVYEQLEQLTTKTICEESLNKKDYSIALRAIKDMLSSLEQNTTGIKNEGLFANHVLIEASKHRSDWERAKEKAKAVIGKTSGEMLSALGYEYEPIDELSYVLKVASKKRSLGILLKPDELIDIQNKRFGNLSPITHAFNIADRENLPFVIICSANTIRLYSTDVNTGVGRKGRTETYVHCQTNLLRDSNLAHLWLIFSAESINQKGAFFALLDDSKRFSGNLAEKLRERIYNDAVPILAQAIAENFNQKKLSKKELEKIYSLTMLLLFRLLFIAYAEDKDLLPYKRNDLYKKKSLKSIALEIKNLVSENKVEFSSDTNYWDNLKHIFFAINNGNKQWGVPIYNGALFSQDINISKHGKELDELKLSDNYIGRALQNLLLIEENNILGPVDFRSLGVREFGTIYEGLLESSLSYADQNLEVLKNNILKPIIEKDKKPDIKKGSIFLHNRSGERKSTGSYYTKSFAVDYLLEKSLDPAIEDHLKKIDKLDDEQAGELYFDFKIADIAMGSGHFLVSAVDRIEAKFSNYLSTRKIPKITQEIEELKISSKSNLSDLASQIEVEDSQLLRRLIARRCIYGVDINPTAVNLARLSIWIHTFVPGLPLSFLDHNLVVGNSLVGIGTLDEIKDKYFEDEKEINMPSLLFKDPTSLLVEAIKPLEQLSKLSDATLADIKKAEQANKEALESIKPIKILCDIVTASRIQKDKIEILIEKFEKDLATLFGSSIHNKYKKIIDSIKPFHFPIAFPEIFLSEKKGFDLIIGNPPWERVKIEEHAFWARNFPGLRGMTQRKREIEQKKLKEEWPDLVNEYETEIQNSKILRNALVTGTYQGMGTGDPDLYKAFAWRFVQLIHKNACLGVVLPRSAFFSKGNELMRRSIFENSNVEIIHCINKKGWVFDDAHYQYTVCLTSINKSKKNNIKTLGPINSFDEFKKIGRIKRAEFNYSSLDTWSDCALIPILSSDQAVKTFNKMRKFDNLYNKKNESWVARGTIDVHPTNDKHMFNFSEIKPKNSWPVYSGDSFNLFSFDYSKTYAWIDKDKIIMELQKRRKNSKSRKKSIYTMFQDSWIEDVNTLPCFHPRIVFRKVTNRTNMRTLIASLAPPESIFSEAAQYILFSRADVEDQLFLLGVLSSRIFDWYVRNIVESNIAFYLLHYFPIPRVNKNDKNFKRFLEIISYLFLLDKKFSNWFSKINIDSKQLESIPKNTLINELNSLVAIFYKLEKEDITHIFQTFHYNWNYRDDLKETLKYYNLKDKKVLYLS